MKDILSEFYQINLETEGRKGLLEERDKVEIKNTLKTMETKWGTQDITCILPSFSASLNAQ